MTAKTKSAVRPEFAEPGDGSRDAALAELAKKKAELGTMFSNMLTELEGYVEGRVTEPPAKQQLADAMRSLYQLTCKLMEPAHP